MPEPYLADSNILLRLSRRDDPYHLLVREAIARLLKQGTPLFYSHQNIAEFWNVWTRPRANNGLGMSAASALTEVRGFERMMSLLPDSSAGYAAWLEIVSKYGVSGVKVHDARIVALMSTSGIRRLLTLNVDDFRRYDNLIEAIRPGDVAAATTG